jgi:hypothetical protein
MRHELQHEGVEKRKHYASFQAVDKVQEKYTSTALFLVQWK